VINIGNFTRERQALWAPGQSTWPGAEPARAVRVRRGWSGSGGSKGSGLRTRTAALGLAAWVLLGWLAAIPRWLGDRLFAANDAEAFFWSWQITRVHAGLGRRYRDPWFDTLAECGRCRGAGTAGGGPCPSCAGTGRITLGGVI
jgi:hypothetical protein